MIDTRSRRMQRLTALAARACLFAFGVHLGFYLAREPTFGALKSWGPLNAQVGFQPSRVHPPSYAGSSSSDLHANSPFQPSGSNPVNPACLAYPSLGSDVVIVVKTGATEALNRIPMQLLTFLSCAKDDVLLFSDMEQEIGGFHIYDALVDVVGEARTVNSDFELYEMQKQVKLFGEDISSLKKGQEAWALDKYKNIHTARKAWELRPNRPWYFFIDADTYIIWSSFLAWLKRLDPTKDIYLGNTIHTLNLFAHGGSGYMVSRTGMLEIVGSEDAPKIAADFDISASTTCCGDAELAGSLSHKNVSLIDAYPLINNHKPRDMPFGSMHWCQPIITMHHMNAEEINDLWQFEQSRRNPEAPLLFEELFSAYVFPKFSPQRTDWDNLSDEIAYHRAPQEEENEEERVKETGNSTRAEHSRFWLVTPNPKDYDSEAISDCARACRETASCFQYLWDGFSCKLSTKFFKLGGMKQEEGLRWVSGWDLERVREFQRESGHCGNGLWEYHE